jgi:hypothetical protein
VLVLKIIIKPEAMLALVCSLTFVALIEGLCNVGEQGKKRIVAGYGEHDGDNTSQYKLEDVQEE